LTDQISLDNKTKIKINIETKQPLKFKGYVKPFYSIQQQQWMGSTENLWC